MGILQASSENKDVEIYADKHEIQLPSLEMGCNTFFFFPFILGILQKQAFHFHPLTEDIPSYSLMLISSTQKLLLIID